MISRVRRMIYNWYTLRPHLGCIKWLCDFGCVKLLSGIDAQ